MIQRDMTRSLLKDIPHYGKNPVCRETLSKNLPSAPTSQPENQSQSKSSSPQAKFTQISSSYTEKSPRKTLKINRNPDVHQDIVLSASYHPKIKSDTWPSTPLFGVLAEGVVVAVVGAGNAGALTPGMLGPQPRCGVAGFSATPARLNADVAGASLIGVPGVGVLEFIGDGASTTAIALDWEVDSGRTPPPPLLLRSMGWPSRASACAGSYTRS